MSDTVSIKMNDDCPTGHNCLFSEKLFELSDEITCLRAENERLREFVKMIAGQPLSSELDAGVKEGADYEGAYDSFINDARAILKGDN